jgi:hypothetical protein
MLISTAMLCGSILLFVLGMIFDRSSASTVSTAILVLLVVVVSNFVFAAERIQLVEKGIWNCGGLIPWDKIGSYGWTGDSKLSVRTRGALSVLTSCAISFPAEHRDFIEAALRRHGVSN